MISTDDSNSLNTINVNFATNILQGLLGTIFKWINASLIDMKCPNEPILLKLTGLPTDTGGYCEQYNPEEE